jgi:hypothetical protein
MGCPKDISGDLRATLPRLLHPITGSFRGTTTARTTGADRTLTIIHHNDHADAPHNGVHSDFPHGDAHADTVHFDFSHLDFGHGDNNHLDWPHLDNHSDEAH